jgi:DNA-binding CsgD family transcriptional regulator
MHFSGGGTGETRPARPLGRLSGDGASTRDIARAMFVSENTVHDHLKSIFAKTGTRTRQTLLARVLGR